MNERLVTKVLAELALTGDERESCVEALRRGNAGVSVWMSPSPPLSEDEEALSLPNLPARSPYGIRCTGKSIGQVGYSLDLSSFYLASALWGVEVLNPCLLDLCSSPGGKALFAAWSLNPLLLVCNEVAQGRVAALIANLKECGVRPVRVTSSDPSYFASQFAESFDLVLVDAPCSGQSLLAKGERQLGAFHPSVIAKCVGRQRRIVATAAQGVMPGGYLAYLTCAYSMQENEGVVGWLLQQFPDFAAVEVAHLQALRSPLAPFPSYRILPHQGLGSGGFVCLLQRQGERSPVPSYEGLRVIWRQD